MEKPLNWLFLSGERKEAKNMKKLIITGLVIMACASFVHAESMTDGKFQGTANGMCACRVYRRNEGVVRSVNYS